VSTVPGVVLHVLSRVVEASRKNDIFRARLVPCHYASCMYVYPVQRGSGAFCTPSVHAFRSVTPII
jgi:hypothetical protein